MHLVRSIFYFILSHDVAEVAGATSFSFGEREEERYVMLFKKEYAPTDEELNGYRRGETWDPEEAKELAKQRADEAEETRLEEERREPVVVAPTTDYMDKYKKIVGDESAVEGARNLTPNKQFGFVPSENKKDKRSVEETMDQIRAKKKQKAAESEVEAAAANTSTSDS
ncbi:putative sperm-associated antigen 7 [Apostichopus japonicus]|uniref:Putative sperm-associated antigen 7 n=1 Tax=Stichopus japonicus TaxID=307972 RepID=A0A2G8KDK8_STIJA|nr:putative sperm-associated antigen 7 [Apostichopus japonicus]